MIPRTWLLLGQKTGDNNQLLALAEALAWPFETRQLRYRAWELLTNRLLGATLAGVDSDNSSPLRPPWPDLLLTAGRRNEPVARWIRKQSSNPCRLVHIGRPWSALTQFDLIVTTPQYSLPQRDNILHNLLPLHRINAQRLIDAGSELQPKLGGMPRPFTAVLIGGNSGAYRFTAAKGRRFGSLIEGLAKKCGGSILISGSARTPPAFFDAVLEQLTVPMRAWRWQTDADDNPYTGYLALADQFIVTGESMSMLSEAASTEMPVYIFDPGDHSRWWWLKPANWHHQVISQRLSHRLAPKRMRRDVGKIQNALVDSGRAVWLGSGWIDPLTTSRIDAPRDMERAVAQIRALFY